MRYYKKLHPLILIFSSLLFGIFMKITNNYNSLFFIVSVVSFSIFILSSSVIQGLILSAIDYFFGEKETFKSKFKIAFNSIIYSYDIFLPVIICGIIFGLFKNIELKTSINIMMVMSKFVCPFVTYLSYKYVSSKSWTYTLKIISTYWIFFVLISGIRLLFI